jgi:tRNA A-37 threonylcarbamoyl transferase component Bud32
MPSQQPLTGDMPPVTELVDTLCDRFENAWRGGDAPTLAPFLPADGPVRAAALVPLLCIELEMRLRRGEAARAEAYLGRFPELLAEPARALAVVAHEWKVRRAREPDLKPDEYRRRFPQLLTQPEWDHLFPPSPSDDEFPATVPSEMMAPASCGWPAVPGYEILGELGRGGMGVVYKARQAVLNRDVALKTVLGEGQPDPRELSRFMLEAEAAAALRHPSVVQVYEFGEWTGRPFMALELLPGGTLAARLAGGKYLNSREAAVLVGKVARGVAAAHAAGLVHRDLKPENVLFDAAGTPKVTDFGLVKMGKKDLTQTGAIMGTPAYMAPEQGRDAKYVGPPADVWALGVMLYECLTGTRPFQGADVWELLRKVLESDPAAPRHRMPGLPRDLELVCLKCLEKNPADRYPSATELADDLEKFAAGGSVSVRPTGLVERAYKWAKRRPTAATAWGLGMTVAGLLAFGGIVLGLWRDADAAKRTAESSFAREADARQAEAEATRQADEARNALVDLERSRRRERAQAAKDRVIAQLPDLRRRALWVQALSLLSEAKTLLSPDSEHAATDQLALEESYIRLLAQLDEVRMRKAALAAEHPEKVWNAGDISKAYQEAFRQAGYDFSGSNREQVIATTSAKLSASPIKDELIVALDDWAWAINEDSADVMWETTARVTGRKWRKELRFTSLSAPEALRLSREVPIEQFTPAIVTGLGFTMRLFLSGDKRHAVRWLEAGAKHWPADFWVNFYLGTEYQRLNEPESAAGAFRAAAALRPDALLPRKCLDKCLEEIERRRRGADKGSK